MSVPVDTLTNDIFSGSSAGSSTDGDVNRIDASTKAGGTGDISD